MDGSVEYDRAIIFVFLGLLVNIVFTLVAWLDARRQQRLALQITS